MDKADRPAKGRSRAQFYTKRETGKLPECAKGEEIYIPVMLALFYGLRRSEVCGLPRDSIDRENDRIRIDRNAYCDVLREGKPIVITDEIKAESSRRTLPLLPAIEDLLRREKQRQETYRGLFRGAYCTDYLDYVCVDQMGRLLRPNYVTEHFAWIIQKYGLRKIRFHDLRHTAASLLLANGVPMKQIQIWLGHSTFSTTADIYAHLDVSAQRETGLVAANLYDAAPREACDRAEAREPRVSAS